MACGFKSRLGYQYLKKVYNMSQFSILMAIVILLGLVGVASCTSSLHFNDTEVIATVNDKESVSSKDSHTYLIFTDKGTFENSDSLFRGKFDSSDWYSQIEKGKTYKFTIIGWRIPFLSAYKNIIKMEEVN